MSQVKSSVVRTIRPSSPDIGKPPCKLTGWWKLSARTASVAPGDLRQHGDVGLGDVDADVNFKVSDATRIRGKHAMACIMNLLIWPAASGPVAMPSVVV